MSAPDDGELFIDSLLTSMSEQDSVGDNQDVPDEEDFDDDRNDFTTDRIDEAALGDEWGHPDMPPTDDRSIESTNSPDENSAIPGTSPIQNIPPPAAGGFAAQSILQPNNNSSTTAEVDPTIRKTRSLAHHLFVANKVVFVSFDIETGGEYCGIYCKMCYRKQGEASQSRYTLFDQALAAHT